VANTVKTVQIIVDAKDQASKVIGGIGHALSTALGTFAGGAALGIASKGFDALSGAISGGISDAREAAGVFAQTQAVIASTGGAAGVSAQQVADMAGSLSAAAGKSVFGDDDIQRGQNMLLTFTNIKDTLPDATQVMLDMAQATGSDMKGSALQLGKALNDPVKGISALSRVGVTFTKQQKDQIEAMQKAGDTAGAQKVILGELTKEFGGSAAAAAAAAGPQAQFADQMGELGEKMGTLLLPVLNDVFGFLASDAVQGALSGVIDGMSGVIEAIDNIVNAFALGGFSEGMQEIWLALSSFGNDLLTWVASVVPGLLAQLATWGQAFIDWVAPMIPPALAALGALVEQIWAWIVAQAPVFVAQLAAWGQAFIDWVAPMIPPALAKIGELANGLIAWIGQQAAPILASLGDWAKSMIAWIAPMIPKFLAEWPALLNSFLDWIGQQAGPILAKLGDWVVSFLAWVIPMIPGFIAEVAKIAAAILIWVAETAGVLLAKIILEWVPAFINWIATDAIPKLVPALGKMLDAIGAWITGTAVPWLTSEAGKLGTAIVDGIKAMVSAGGKLIGDAIAAVIRAALDKAKSIFKIGSPSRVFAEEVGAPIVQGIVAGLETNAGDVSDAVGALAAAAGIALTQDQQAAILATWQFVADGIDQIMIDEVGRLNHIVGLMLSAIQSVMDALDTLASRIRSMPSVNTGGGGGGGGGNPDPGAPSNTNNINVYTNGDPWKTGKALTDALDSRGL